jgi:carbonic anhydrase/SulP family sulfate permease
VLIDARRTDYIDPDVLSLICEFKDVTAPVYDIQVGLAGFRDKYNLVDTVETIDFGPRENRDNLTALQVVGILAEGNTRYAEGHPLDRALRRNLDDVGNDPCPIAAILTGIDSQSPAEMIFDLGLGDAYVLRVPGNVVGPRTIGGFEFATAIGGVKVIVVMGHADSSLLSLAIKNAALGDRQLKLDGCDNLDYILNELSQSVDATAAQGFQNLSPSEQEAFLNAVIRRHVARSVNQVPEQAPTLKRLIERGQLAVVGAVYDPKTGKVEFDMQGAIGIS